MESFLKHVWIHGGLQNRRDVCEPCAMFLSLALDFFFGGVEEELEEEDREGKEKAIWEMCMGPNRTL